MPSCLACEPLKVILQWLELKGLVDEKTEKQSATFLHLIVK